MRSIEMGIVQVDYEVGQEVWKLFRTSGSDWTHNLNTILHWSSSLSEDDLFDRSVVFALALFSIIQNFCRASRVQSAARVSWYWYCCYLNQFRH